MLQTRFMVRSDPKFLVVEGIRRMLGRLYDDPFFKEYNANLPYRLVLINDRPKIQVKYKDKEKTVTPEEIFALLIEKMVKIGETALGENVKVNLMNI